jgi:predicted butyrate kinase (DUF1464 family)
MTNLIPPAAKKQIISEYWIRVCSVWVILWSVCLMISASLLWPTYVLIVGSSAAYADSVADASERTAEYEVISQSLSRATTQAQTIIVSDRQTKLSVIFSDITDEAGQGVSVSGVTLSRNDQGIAPVRIQGIATSRQSLAAFKDRLEAIAYVAGVDLPIENLAQSQNIEFNILTTINNDEL